MLLFVFGFLLCDATLDDGWREYNRKRMNEYLLLDSYVGECQEWWDTSHQEPQTRARMANPMAAALLASGSFEPVCVARQGNNLAEETR